jgi:ABC-2 type transport system ATP-binding protein
MATIEVRGLHKRYGETVAVDGIDLTVERGEIFGVLGRNGAGKTTLIECIIGLRVPDQGEVRVLGLHPHHDRARLRQLMGAQLQESRLPERLRVREAVRLYRSLYPDGADPDRLLDELGLADKCDTAFEDLSGGQQQRLSIALALVGHPRVAVLDELTTGLDPRSRRDMWTRIEQIRDSGVTVLLVTHFMDEAHRLCDRVAVVHRGRIVALDTPAGLVAGRSTGRRLELRTASPVDRDRLRSLSAVHEVADRDGNVVVRGDENLLPAVVADLTARGVRITACALEHDTLEEVFLELTGGAPSAHDTMTEAVR